MINVKGIRIHNEALYWFLQTAGEIHHRHVWGWHSEGHPGQFAIEGRYHLADGLGSTGGSRDDVLGCSTAVTPFLRATGSLHPNKNMKVNADGHSEAVNRNQTDTFPLGPSTVF